MPSSTTSTRIALLLTLLAAGCGPRVEYVVTRPPDPAPVEEMPSARAIRQPVVAWRAVVGGAGYLNVPVVRGDLVVVSSSGSRHNERDARDGVYGVGRYGGIVRWHVRAESDVNGLTVHEGVAYAGTDGGRVLMIDIDTGTLSGRIVPPPLTTGRTATAPSAGPLMGFVVFDPPTGGGSGTGTRAAPRPPRPTGPSPIFGAPLPLGDSIYFGDQAGRIFRYQRGALTLVTQVGGLRAPLVADGPDAFIYASLDGTVGRVHVTQGPTWQSNVPGEVYGAPLVTEDRVVVGYARDSYYNDPALVALRRDDGRELWRGRPGEYPNDPSTMGRTSRSFGNLRSAPVRVGRRVVWQEPYSGDVAAAHLADGAPAYRARLGDCKFPQWAGLTVLDEHTAYAPRFDGRLYAFDPSTGVAHWGLDFRAPSLAGSPSPAPSTSRGCSWAVDGGQPLYASVAMDDEGGLYLASGHGVLYAIRDATW